jgi:regulator of RNase E activity RraA
VFVARETYHPTPRRLDRPTEKKMNAPDVELRPPEGLELPIQGPPYRRPPAELLEAMQVVSSATAAAMLHKMGIRQTFIQGPLPRTPGAKVVGSALTLQFMPQREDVASGAAQENVEKSSALWQVFRHVLPGDLLCIQAYGDMYTGCVGEMLTTYFKAQGGVGLVADGCVRDWPHIREIGLPMWLRGFTPNYASQTHLFPWACNVPVAVAGVLVMPGDVIIADDDGAVVVPLQMAAAVAEITREHEDWESFSRMKLTEGGSLYKYYPLNDEGREEYEAWRRGDGS